MTKKRRKIGHNGFMICAFALLVRINQSRCVADDLNEYLDFSNNQIPAGWTIGFLPSSPGTNASINNQRFEVGQVDTYAELSQSVLLPATTTSIDISYTTDVLDSSSGMGSQIHLYDSDDNYGYTFFGKEGFGTELMNLGGGYAVNGVSDTQSLNQAFSPNYGTYQVNAAFQTGQVTYIVTQQGAATPLYQGTFAIPQLQLNQVSRIGMFAIDTSGDPAWIDNVSISSSSLNIPAPTQSPVISAFPIATSIYTAGMATFLQNHASEFSSPTQQFLAPISTPNSLQNNMFWKNAALDSGRVLQIAGQITDIITGTQTAPNAAEYIALDLLPAKYQTFASGVDVAAHLGYDFVNKADPVVDLISANSFIWGQLVAPQLESLGEDPPDPNYKSQVVITAFPVASTSTSGPSLTAALGREFNDASHAAVYLQAANTAYNRYSTALTNSDSADAGLQLESALYFMNMYEASVTSASSDITASNALLAQSGITDETYDPEALGALQAQIRSEGLSSSTAAFLADLGLSSDDIAQTTQNILSLDPSAYSGDLHGQLSQIDNAVTQPVPEPSSLLTVAIASCLLLHRVNGKRRLAQC